MSGRLYNLFLCHDVCGCDSHDDEPSCFFNKACHAVLRYSLGVLPVLVLKKRTKCCGYSKPSR